MRNTGCVKQLNVKDEDERILTEKNEICETRKQYIESLLKIERERNAEVSVNPGKTVRIFDKVDQNIT